MTLGRQIAIPHLVRIKPGALDRLGIYVKREGFQRVALLFSDGLPQDLTTRAKLALKNSCIDVITQLAVAEASVERSEGILAELPNVLDCVIGLGGGKALDTTKFIGHLMQKVTLVVPTSLSNDGFCSPQSSLTVSGKRQSMPSMMPSGLVVDTEVCLQAPKVLWQSGVGDLVSKITAVRDWKLAFHRAKTPVDDFAALLSDASVFQFMGRPEYDLEGMRLLATALMLNGVSMSVAGNSRPASGSEHLISHALDATSAQPRLHGLQVGVAAYLLSQLHQDGTEAISELFTKTGFWETIRSAPFSRREWRTAIKLAPSMKSNFFTILSEADQTDRLMRIIESDPVLEACFGE